MSTGNTELTPNLSPNFEVAPPQDSGERLKEKAMEQRGPQETPASSAPPVPTPDPHAMPLPPDPDDNQASQAPAAKPTPLATAHLPAEDSDLIEKEWVTRAKHIVAETKNDPYIQNTEMSKVKADYIQKRFNKTIKVDDAAKA